MLPRQRFISALHHEPLQRPPVWVMRQAGRYLPEYRALKEKYDFLTMVKNPELATEVTLQPLKRFALDAAILFSDILVIPEAMGQPYFFRDEGGIGMEFAIRTRENVKRLHPQAIPEKLEYLAHALRLVKQATGETHAVLGFAGSPWTLATYMVEGGSSKDFSNIRRLYFEDRLLFSELMEKVTDGVIRLLKMQIAAGADALQIFDSWASACPGPHYEAMSLKWIQKVIMALPRGFPIILFAKGMIHHLPALVNTGARIIGVDQSVHLPSLQQSLPPHIGLQGNIDPQLLELPPAIVEAETIRFLKSMHYARGHIVNLGHGIRPQARIDSMETFIKTINAFH